MHRQGLAILHEPPIGLSLPIGIDDAGHTTQRFGGFRHPVLLEQRGRAGDDQPHIGDLAGDERGIGQRRYTQRHVDPFIDEVDIAVLQSEIEGHFRVFEHELKDGRRQGSLAEIARRRHPQQPARRGRLIRNRGIEIIELLQQLARLAIIRLPRLGQRQLARCAVHQAHPEIVLEVGNIFRQQCLGAPVLSGRGRKPTGIEHLHEGTDAGQVLGHLTPSSRSRSNAATSATSAAKPCSA